MGNFSSVVLCLAFIFNLLACSRGATPEATTRAVTSIPPTLTVPGAANKERESQRKNQVIQRSRTGGLENLETPRTPSPTKSKLNFLEGFRNTLRARSPVRSNSVPVRVKSFWHASKKHLGSRSVIDILVYSKGTLLLPSLDVCRYLLFIALPSVVATLNPRTSITDTKE